MRVQTCNEASKPSSAPAHGTGQPVHLRSVLEKLAELRREDSLTSLLGDRRGVTRRHQRATIAVGDGESPLVKAPLIEFSQSGARLVLHNAIAGQKVSFVISTANRVVSGRGRIAWTSPLSNGRAVVGMEIIRFASEMRADQE